MLAELYFSSQVRPLPHLVKPCTDTTEKATLFVHIVAIIMTAIMIYHIRSKYTAVGRKEIVTFFWMYMVIQLLAMFLDTSIIPTSNAAYPVCSYLDFKTALDGLCVHFCSGLQPYTPAF